MRSHIGTVRIEPTTHMLSKTYASALQGVDAKLITVETHTGNAIQSGGPVRHIVGLPDKAVSEGFMRINPALRNQGFKPARRVLTINLAPASLRKEGSAYDLPIAVGILESTDQIAYASRKRYMLIGELALDGKLRPVRGVLPMAIAAQQQGFAGFIVPAANADEASIVKDLEVYGAKDLREVVDHLEGKRELPRMAPRTTVREDLSRPFPLDFNDVMGQENIKRSLEIAAAGGHNAILIGPPGAGKTMLARRLPTILPPLSIDEALETTKIHSVAGKLPSGMGLVANRPFRAPHHTISDVALVGGGANPMPGEISLAHNGVLFLDELPEFKRSVLEVMRQPMEERRVTISRARWTVDYPASFMLLASMNPCPCGFYNHPTKECTCGGGKVKSYLNKISGPLLDRIDLHVEVVPVGYDELSREGRSGESSAEIAKRVVAARGIQQQRFRQYNQIHCNAQMPSRLVRDTCPLDNAGRRMLETAMERLQLSARAYDRILKVARTIADLGNSKQVGANHLAEAIQFRALDRGNWAG